VRQKPLAPQGLGGALDLPNHPRNRTVACFGPILPFSELVGEQDVRYGFPDIGTSRLATRVRESKVKTSLNFQALEHGLGESRTRPPAERCRWIPKAAYNQTIYSIRPEVSAAANKLRILSEDGRILFRVRTEIFPLKGRLYTVYDDADTVFMTTRQDNAAVFPCYTVLRSDMPVATVGQLGIMPLQYFVKCLEELQLHVRMPALQSTFELKEAKGGRIVAELTERGSTWFVALSNDDAPELILPLIAMIYKENTIGC